MSNSLSGHATITNYLLNYYPGLDLERRNIFGFTALMKAAMQGRTECVRALMLAGKVCLSSAVSRVMIHQGSSFKECILNRPVPLTETVIVRDIYIYIYFFTVWLSSFEFQ